MGCRGGLPGSLVFIVLSAYFSPAVTEISCGCVSSVVTGGTRPVHCTHQHSSLNKTAHFYEVSRTELVEKKVSCSARTLMVATEAKRELELPPLHPMEEECVAHIQ